MKQPVLTAFSIATTVLAIVACSNVIPMAADHGPIPLDSTRAVAVARRNVCGSVAADSTCPVYSYEHAGSRFLVVLDRRPPAGNDRVAVTLRDNGMRVNVEPVATAPGNPNR
jgi:hypothetical protein